jgi:alpha-beta hydrolase superfamily lysophospholipase
VTAGSESPEPQPTLAVQSAAGSTHAVAIVLPGGRADSFELAQSRHLSAVRMRPFARALHRAGREAGLTVALLRYRYRGWNGAEMSPVADAEWALDQMHARHGDVPVALVGHSMGGRTALRVAGDDSVRGIAALAPWLPDGEPVDQLSGCGVLIAHGTADRVTSPRASQRYAERARTVAAKVDYVAVGGEGHAMLRHAPTWHRLVARFTLQLID